MQEEQQHRGVRTRCVLCGGDPGGIVWEGYVLPAVLRIDDIRTMLDEIVERKTILRWFNTRVLNGTKLGKGWAIRASQFVADWEALEQRRPDLPIVQPRPPRRAVRAA